MSGNCYSCRGERTPWLINKRREQVDCVLESLAVIPTATKSLNSKEGKDAVVNLAWSICRTNSATANKRARQLFRGKRNVHYIYLLAWNERSDDWITRPPILTNAEWPIRHPAWGQTEHVEVYYCAEEFWGWFPLGGYVVMLTYGFWIQEACNGPNGPVWHRSTCLGSSPMRNWWSCGSVRAKVISWHRPLRRKWTVTSSIPSRVRSPRRSMRWRCAARLWIAVRMLRRSLVPPSCRARWNGVSRKGEWLPTGPMRHLRPPHLRFAGGRQRWKVWRCWLLAKLRARRRYWLTALCHVLGPSAQHLSREGSEARTWTSGRLRHRGHAIRVKNLCLATRPCLQTAHSMKPIRHSACQNKNQSFTHEQRNKMEHFNWNVPFGF